VNFPEPGFAGLADMNMQCKPTDNVLKAVEILEINK
jgi:hypothetical protein